MKERKNKTIQQLLFTTSIIASSLLYTNIDACAFDEENFLDAPSYQELSTEQQDSFIQDIQTSVGNMSEEAKRQIMEFTKAANDNLEGSWVEKVVDNWKEIHNVGGDGVAALKNAFAYTANTMMVDLGTIGADLLSEHRAFVLPYSMITANLSSYSASDDLAAQSKIRFQPFYRYSSQDFTSAIDAYKLTSYGASIGVESEVTDHIVLGAAGTFGNSKQNYTAFDKMSRDAFSTVGSVYMTINPANNFTLHGSFTMSKSDIDTHKTSIENKAQIIKGTYTSYDMEPMLGYNISLAGGNFTPMLGIRFSQIDVSAQDRYDPVLREETTVAPINQIKLDMLVGASISKSLSNQDEDISVEAHAMVERNITGNDYNSERKISSSDNTALTISSVFGHETSLNLGGSVIANSDNIEYGVSLNGNFAEGYMNFSGALKVKVSL
jgi:hypothetical protein